MSQASMNIWAAVFQIVRRGILNFIPLRKYDETLQKYLLGLGPVMLTYPLDHDYRSGTLLVQDPERLPKFEIVYRSGKRESNSDRP